MRAIHVALLSIIGFASPVSAADRAEARQTGVTRRAAGAFEGYTLFAPLQSTMTYLVDMDGNVVHSWKDEYPPGQAVYLLGNGDLLRSARDPDNHTFGGGGTGGLLRRFDWDGKLVWEFDCCDETRCQHHDIEPLPNGNVLVLAWERKSEEEALAAGRDPDLVGQAGLWPDQVLEIKPEGRRGGRIVWEWHVWDHLVQDCDESRANFGPVEAHPELIDVNYVAQSSRVPPAEMERLRALGYVGAADAERDHAHMPDWNHTNSIAYNAELDQILLSVLNFNEIWVIDHSTTVEEAAGHAGGRSGKGGDLLYRWGNPQAYRAGEAADQRLFAQHDARWIPAGSPGAGHILVFNNGRGRPDGRYTSVEEIVPPLGRDGKYALEAGKAYGPAAATWSYTARNKSEFFAGHISGAERLPNGNTLICSGEEGRLFEVDGGGKMAWEYVSPFGGELGPPGGRLGPPGGGFGLPGGSPMPPGGDRRGQRPPGPGARGRDGGPGAGRGPHRPPHGPPGGHNDERNAMFRATRLGPDHPGLRGRELTAEASKTVEP